MTTIALLLVGCGKMGGALLNRWKNVAAIEHFHVIDPHHVYENDGRITWHRNLDSLPANYTPNVVVLAVKPQQLDEVLPNIRDRLAGTKPIFISIAAGKTLAYYLSHLGEHAHVVRAMPNTPALAGFGMTALCGSSTLPAYAQKVSLALLEAVGKVEWLDDESKMDAITAISGCGPAYVFAFMESMVKAAVEIGISEHMAKTLVTQTVVGSLVLAEHTGKSLEDLRVQVASPGGATEAALRVLMESDALENLIKEAVLAAQARSKELS